MTKHVFRIVCVLFSFFVTKNAIADTTVEVFLVLPT